MKFDMKKFREAKSCTNALNLPAGTDYMFTSPNKVDYPRFCAVGKAGLAMGVYNEDGSISDSLDWLELKAFFGHNWPWNWNEVVETNNLGQFEKADDMILEAIIKSGKVEIINANEDIEIESKIRV